MPRISMSRTLWLNGSVYKEEVARLEKERDRKREQVAHIVFCSSSHVMSIPAHLCLHLAISNKEISYQRLRKPTISPALVGLIY
jgi:ribosomal protein L32